MHPTKRALDAGDSARISGIFLGLSLFLLGRGIPVRPSASNASRSAGNQTGLSIGIEKMNPYSHIVVASKLESLVDPKDQHEYYWGAIAPDIRYLAAMQREQTHIPPETIIGFMSQYSHLQSFLQGYLVHCLCDEIELKRVFFQHFPFSIFRRRMSHQQVAILLELYYFENEQVYRKLSESHNEVLSQLGLSETQSTKLSRTIHQYASSSSFESRITDLAGLLGLEHDRRIDKYMSAAKRFQNNRLLKNGLFFGIRRGKISEQIVSTVESLYRQWNM